MGWDGAGGYNRTHNFSADSSAGVKILAQRMDAEFNDFASAMTLVLTRNGQNEPTTNLPMGGRRHVNVGAPASATDYLRGREFITNVPIYVADVEVVGTNISASATFYTTVSANQAPMDGSRLLVKVACDKSASCALHLNAGGGTPHSANIYDASGDPIYNGAMISAGIYEFIYNSVFGGWQILNPGLTGGISDYARLSQQNDFQDYIEVNHASSPMFAMHRPDAGTDVKHARFEVDSDGSIRLRLYSDGLTTNNSVIIITRSSIEASTINFPSGILQYDGEEVATTSSGSFTGTLTGMTTTIQGTVNWARSGKHVTLRAPSTIQGTSNATTMFLTGLPAAIRPTGVQNIPAVGVAVGSVYQWGFAIVEASSSVELQLGVCTSAGATGYLVNVGFPNTGTKGLSAGWQITYCLT